MKVFCRKCGREYEQTLENQREFECPHRLISTLENDKYASAEKNTGSESKEGCFIATACYGSYEHASVQDFRWFRDAGLKQFALGRRFIKLYYQFSPPVARFLHNRPLIAAIVRKFILAPVLKIICFLCGRRK